MRRGADAVVTGRVSLVGWVAVIAITSAGVAGGAEPDASLQAVEATVRVHGGGQSGTAYVVALPKVGSNANRGLLVSAAHTFEKMNGLECTAVFRGRDASGGWVRRDAAIGLRDGESPRWVRHPSADIAVLVCDVPEGVDLAPFPLGQVARAADFEAGRVRLGQRVRVACFPAQTEGNGAGWPVLRTGAIATFPLTPAASLERFFVDYSHFGGDSGAAVVTDDAAGEPLVAGVVVAMQRQTDRVTSPFEEKTIHTPLGLAIVVPATLLHETIELWRTKAEAAPVTAGDAEAP